METLKAAVIGAGNMGRHLPQLAKFSHSVMVNIMALLLMLIVGRWVLIDAFEKKEAKK